MGQAKTKQNKNTKVIQNLLTFYKLEKQGKQWNDTAGFVKGNVFPNHEVNSPRR